MPNSAPAVRQLWVFPADVILNTTAASLAALLPSEFGCKTWLLDEGRALALAFDEVIVIRGRAVDYPKYLSHTRPLFCFLAGFLKEDYCALDLEVPDSQFWPRVTLQPGETDRRYCRYIKSMLTGWSPFAFRVYSHSVHSEGSRASLRAYLEKSFAELASNAVVGETLKLGTATWRPYRDEATTTAYPRDGFEIRCSEYVPVTWPWLEFYLRARRELRPRQGVSLKFFKPEA